MYIHVYNLGSPEYAEQKVFSREPIETECDTCYSSYDVNVSDNNGYKWQPPDGLTIGMINGKELSDYWEWLKSRGGAANDSSVPKTSIEITPLKPSWMDYVGYERDCSSSSDGCYADSQNIFHRADWPTQIYVSQGQRILIGYNVDETIIQHLNGTVEKNYKVFMSSYTELSEDPELESTGWFVHIRREPLFVSRYKSTSLWALLASVGGIVPILQGACVGVLALVLLCKKKSPADRNNYHDRLEQNLKLESASEGQQVVVVKQKQAWTQ